MYFDSNLKRSMNYVPLDCALFNEIPPPPRGKENNDRNNLPVTIYVLRVCS